MTTRRTFLGSVAATILAPTLRLEPTTNVRHDLLARFCGDSYGRFDFKDPFVVRGNAYASDGCALARIWTTAEEVDEERKQKLPNTLLEVWDEHWSTRERTWRELPKVDYVTGVESAVCPYCWDAAQTCPVCEGEGYGLDMRECKRCGGRGYIVPVIITCHICGGRFEGETIASHCVLGPHKINVRYYDILHNIPGCEFNIANCGKSILFRGEAGIHGIVMPMVFE